MSAALSDRRPSWDALLLTSFDRGDATDRSSYARVPTVGSGATVSTRTYDFDGTANAVISYPDNTETEVFPLTVMAWVYIDTYTGFRAILNKMTQTGTAATYTGWHFYYGPGISRGLVFGWAEETFTKFRAYYTSTGTLAAGAWYHVAATAASFSATPVLYINGVAQSTTSGSGAGVIATIANSEPVRIAGKGAQDAGWSYHDGKIDDVRIYNRVLSAVEIHAIYAEEMGVTRP